MKPFFSPPNARTFAWLVLGTLAFILYGSLVPFEFRDRPAGKVIEAFTGAMAGRVRFQSRADALANLLLGVPLGFSLLAMACVDRGSTRRELLLGILFFPLCVAFSATVEFLQLYCPTRTCAASDVLMQALGVLVGMAGWIFAGQWLTLQARQIWAGPRIGGSAGRLLILYLALLAFVQALPLDLTLSPRDVYKNLRDKVHYVPFSDLLDEDHFWHRLRSSTEVVALYLPVGLLAGCLPGRFWQSPRNAGRILGLAFLLGGVMESIQLFVMSRTPSSTDVILGAGTVLLGWWLARQARAARLTLSLGLVWTVALLVANWQPFDVSSEMGRVEWLLLLPLEVRNPLMALGDLITKLILFAPLGVVAVCEGGWLPSRQRLVLAAGAGLAVSFVIEAGQLMMPAHTPSVTDVALGGAGAWAGALTALRVRGDQPGPRLRPIGPVVY